MLTDPWYLQNSHHGIYEIRDPGDSRTVYVGKTRIAKEGIAQRVWDHAKSISSLLINLGITPEQFLDYQVRSIALEDARLRGLAEFYAIAVLDPPGNLVC